MLKSQNVVLKPNQHMQSVIEMNCDYRRYCWNQGLALWNDMYAMHSIIKDNPLPNERKIRNQLVADKQDWQYSRSARILQLAIKDLSISFKAFFDKQRPTARHPKFISKKRPKQSFKTDRAKIVNGRLRLDRPHGVDKNTFYDIKMCGFKQFNGDLKMVNIKILNGRYIGTLFYEVHENQVTKYTNQKTAVDINVSHFDYTDKNHPINVLPDKMVRWYTQNDYYQKCLANKRNANPKTYQYSKQYQVVLQKLNRNYRKIKNLQKDIFHKFTHLLITNFDSIVIEDLQVHHMMMTHVASKGMQRSAFGLFRQILTYKCDWYGKHLIIADKLYPSTQLCSHCGYRKVDDDRITLQGNRKHHTKHNQYVCYHCGLEINRDENAVLNLLKLAN